MTAKHDSTYLVLQCKVLYSTHCLTLIATQEMYALCLHLGVPEAGMARFESTCKHCKSRTVLMLLVIAVFLAFFLPTTGPLGPYTLQDNCHFQQKLH